MVRTQIKGRCEFTEMRGLVAPELCNRFSGIASALMSRGSASDLVLPQCSDWQHAGTQ